MGRKSFSDKKEAVINRFNSCLDKIKNGQQCVQESLNAAMHFVLNVQGKTLLG